MSLVIQLCGAAITAAICAMLLKKMRPGSGTAVSAAGILLILLLVLNRYGDAVSIIRSAADRVGFGSYGELMLKSLGIGLTVKIASDICRDCGEDSLAGVIEFAGKLEILLLCLPFVTELLTLSSELMS